MVEEFQFMATAWDLVQVPSNIQTAANRENNMGVRCVMHFLNLTLLKMLCLSILGPQRRDIEEANAK